MTAQVTRSFASHLLSLSVWPLAVPSLPSPSSPDIAVPESAHAGHGRAPLALVPPARASPPRKKGGREERKGRGNKQIVCCQLLPIIVGAHLRLQLSGSDKLRLKVLLLPLQSKQLLTSVVHLL